MFRLQRLSQNCTTIPSVETQFFFLLLFVTIHIFLFSYSQHSALRRGTNYRCLAPLWWTWLLNTLESNSNTLINISAIEGFSSGHDQSAAQHRHRRHVCLLNNLLYIEFDPLHSVLERTESWYKFVYCSRNALTTNDVKDNAFKLRQQNVVDFLKITFYCKT